MSLIEKWYLTRNSRARISQDAADEKTEEENGVKRTITRFPDSAFLSYEDQKEIIESTSS